MSTEKKLKDFLPVLLEYKWWLIAFVTLSVTTTAIVSFKQPNVYRAASTVLINKEAPKVVEIKEVQAAAATGNEFILTQIKVLSSRNLADRVIKKLSLQSHPEFGGSDPVKTYYKHVEIIPTRGAMVVEISVSLRDQKLVAQVANTHSEEYIRYLGEQRFGVTGEASEWLEKKAAELQAKMEKSEAALQGYREGKGMVVLEEHRNMTSEKIRQLNSQVSEAKNSRIVAENAFTQFRAVREKGTDQLALPVVMQNPVIQAMKTQINDKANQLVKLQDRYRDKHPALIEARSEMAGLRAQLKQEVDKLSSTVESDYRLALSREQTLEDSLRQLEKEQEIIAADSTQKSIGYEALKRLSESDRQLFESILTRMKQTDISKSLASNNVTILDLAREPLAASSPNRQLNILISLLVSMALAVALCLTYEHMTETVRTSEDIADELNIPFLGYIPTMAPRKSPQSNLSIHQGNTAAGEAFRTVLSYLHLQTETSSSRTFLVTSASPSEGKSTFAIHFAAAFAAKGSKTLLIEADTRRPSLRKTLGLKETGGLEKLPNTEIPFESLIQQTSLPNFHVVATHEHAPNAHQLLAHERVREFINFAKTRFDRVVVDTPPLGPVSDALTLTSLVDGVMWVVRFNNERKRTVLEAFSKLQKIKARVFGVVINDVDFSKLHNRYYCPYNYSYGEYYTEDEGTRKTRKRSTPSSAPEPAA